MSIFFKRFSGQKQKVTQAAFVERNCVKIVCRTEKGTSGGDLNLGLWMAKAVVLSEYQHYIDILKHIFFTSVCGCL